MCGVHAMNAAYKVGNYLMNFFIRDEGMELDIMKQYV